MSSALNIAYVCALYIDILYICRLNFHRNPSDYILSNVLSILKISLKLIYKPIRGLWYFPFLVFIVCNYKLYNTCHYNKIK